MDANRRLIIRMTAAGILSAVWIAGYVSCSALGVIPQMGQQSWDAFVDTMLPLLIIWLFALSPTS
jgi:hypothetical protein